MTERRYTHDDHPTFRDELHREHMERLTGYRALLAEFETMVGNAQLEANQVSGGNPNTASQFTDDLRFLIAFSEEVVNRFRPHPPGESPTPENMAAVRPTANVTDADDEGRTPR